MQHVALRRVTRGLVRLGTTGQNRHLSVRWPTQTRHMSFPVAPSPTPPQTIPVSTPALVSLLTDCTVAMSEFRARLEREGYPFREPESCKRILARLNAMLDSVQSTTAEQ